MKKLLFALALVLFAAMNAQAITIENITWNEVPNVQGYKFYLQNVHNPGETILLRAAKAATVCITIKCTLPAGKTWQLVCTSYRNGIESAYSKPAYSVSTGRVLYMHSDGRVPAVVRGLSIPN